MLFRTYRLTVSFVSLVALGVTGIGGPFTPLEAQEVVVLEPLPPAESSATQESEKKQEPSFNEILGFELSLEGDGAVLEIEASDRLAWRSYLDPAGNLVVELDGVLNEPHTPGLGGLGLISEVVIGHAPADPAENLPPRTRLTVMTLPDSVHWVASDGPNLRLRVLPRTEPMVTPIAPISSEELPPRSPIEAAEPAVENQTVQISYQQRTEVTEIQIRGGGAFQFSELILEDPPRYVVDVAGALLAEQVAIESSDSPVVERIRAAQFRVSPSPVVRVVLDLREPIATTIEILRRENSIQISVPSAPSSWSTAPSAAAPTATSAAASTFEGEIATSIAAWETAWEQQRVEAYLSCYGDQFSPANGITRMEWERLREERLLSPEFVELTIEDQVIQPLGDGRARVTFTQRYRSNTFSDVTSKTLVLSKTTGSWLIVGETTQ